MGHLTDNDILSVIRAVRKTRYQVMASREREVLDAVKRELNIQN